MLIDYRTIVGRIEESSFSSVSHAETVNRLIYYNGNMCMQLISPNF